MSPSTASASAASGVEQEINRLLIPFWYYVDAACITLALYEHLSTFEAESQAIWGRGLNVPTLLFLLNRYSLLLYSLSLALWNLVESWGSDKMCQMSGTLNILVVILNVLVMGVFNSLRIHAINGQRWLWTSLLLLLACASIPYNLADLIVGAFHSFKGVGLPIARGCYEVADRLESMSWNRAAVAVQVCGLLSNVIDVGITWYRTKDIVSVVWTTKMKPSLASSMLRSGVIYCLVNLIFNTIQFYFLVARATSFARVLIPVESILMSRFVLNLRALDSQTPVLDMNTPSGLDLPTMSLRWPGQSKTGGGSISTVLALANIGAPLDLDGKQGQGDEDEP